MPRHNAELLRRVADVGDVQRGLITSAQLVEIGVASSTLRYRIRQGGPWRRVLPSVYALDHGPQDEDRRNAAALLYTGDPVLLTGASALRAYGITAARAINVAEVHVLVPVARKRASTHFVHVQRTTHWPGPGRPDTRLAPLARAVVDTCRALGRQDEVRAVVSEVVRDRRATLDELEAELARAQRRRSALAREVLSELRRGPVSVPELELARLWQGAGLPGALFNPDLYLASGAFVARPDVYVPDDGVVVEVDSRSHHYSPADWDRTMRRHARLSALGLIVLHVTPARIRTDFSGIVAEVCAAIDAQRGRPLPDLVIRPASPS